MRVYIKHIDLSSKYKHYIFHDIGANPLLLHIKHFISSNILNYSIKIKGVVFMEQGIIVYQDPKEFLKVIEQLQEQYNNKQ